MRLHRLRITAFGPFGGTAEIDFDELSAAGLFLLHGPTGAGKTSVLDAVCYALYGGVPGARQQGHALRSDHADPETATEVLLEFTAAGRRLEITRRPEQLRPKKRGSGLTRDKAQSWLREHAAGGYRALSRSHQEIGAEIAELLGMSREQFCQVVLLPQGDFARFLRADAEARARLLGRLFDTRRFAAVEDRLAERRRQAERGVGQGDEELLRLAHRMAQAAGDSPGLADRPLPDLVPGEAELTESVLEWAAVARSGARERLACAESAVVAADSAHRKARRDNDAAAELAALRRRHSEAQARASELRRQGAEFDRFRALLARAESARAVEPALELRAEADREHRAAVREETDCRRLLPADLAQAGGDHLIELERRTREELGALASAGRAERRIRAIEAELAALRREAVADEQLLEESSQWLAGWEATRRALQERVDAAQQAAVRAERLSVRTTTAQRALEAAQRRDELTVEVEQAEETRRRAREAAAEAREHWLDTKERRLRGIAAELAEALTAGQPCAVCGAVEHPAPARPTAGHVDRATEDEAHHGYRLAESDLGLAEERERRLRESLAEAHEEAGCASTAELRTALAEIRADQEAERVTEAGGSEAHEALSRGEREHERRQSSREEAERRAALRVARHAALVAELDELRSEFEPLGTREESISERADRLEERAGLLARAGEAVLAAERATDRLKEADARLADASYRAGFDTPQAALDALLSEPERHRLRERLERWEADLRAVTAVLDEPQIREAATREPADPQHTEAALAAATQRLRDTSAALAAAQTRCTELDQLSARAARHARRLAPLREKYVRLARLAGLAAGTSAENERRMRLESYVLAARLEQVAAVASARLQQMTEGRYTLVHSDAKVAGRSRSGLGLHVIDAWTGKERDTSTLSGGETFVTSLALALGLADVVTEEAGGLRLDTLFIDEGFGSLDETALDQVLDVLDSLRERDRAVGIISHVSELRQRIPVRLKVDKGRAGSTLQRHTTAAGRAPGR
ncbi:AAA family ATPase [Streptomyces sp. TP-A0874]|uniref:AAA family ATPase n=1 Tax=Streptomyces sp. TP-A0874 TaxID=549819 RepID=UPI0008537157|nr:SMC family ATPase [Streptomyces sp. TP-A0874]